MPLTISQKSFNDQSSLLDVKKAIRGLAPPDIVPFDQNIDIQPNEVVKYGQREMAMVRLSSKVVGPVKFLGTDDLLTCLLLHIINEKGEFAGIHVDGSVGSAIAINQLIDSFSSKDSLKVTLMGGLPGATSEEHLDLIITTLLKRKETITLVAQKIIENNVFTKQACLLFIRDDFLSRGKILFAKLFNSVEFNLERYAKYKTEKFKQPNHTVSQEKIQTALSLMLYALPMMTELISEDFYNIIHKPTNMPRLKKAIPTPEKFYEIFEYLFCKKTYEWIVEQYSKVNYFANQSALRNFVFSLETGRVHEISRYMPTPDAMQREIYYHRKLVNHEQHKYFMCYDGDVYVKPIFNDELNAFIKEFSKYLDLPYIPQGEFAPLISRYDHTLFGALRQWNKKFKVEDLKPLSATPTPQELAASNKLKAIDIKPLSKETKNKHQALILAACNGDLEKLKAMFLNPSMQQLDDDIKDNIIQCVLEWSGQSIAIQNSIITFLISKGAGYVQYFLHMNADVALMKRLILCGADVNINHQGYTVLHSLICRENTDNIIDFLLEKGIDINRCDHLYGYGTALHIYLANENFAGALAFIKLAHKYQRKINYSSKDQEEKTPLIIAAKVMSLEMVKKILSDDKSCVDAQDNQGKTALHFACALGKSDIVEVLIKAGANMNIRDKYGNTPAHYATASILSIKYILSSIHIDPDRDCGALKNAIFDKNHLSIAMPNHFLAENKLKTTSFITESTDKNTHGEILATYENILFLKNTLKFAKDEDRACLEKQINGLKGKSISQACLEGQVSVMEKLINHGADVTAANDSGLVPTSNLVPVKNLLLTATQKMVNSKSFPAIDIVPTLNGHLKQRDEMDLSEILSLSEKFDEEILKSHTKVAGYKKAFG